MSGALGKEFCLLLVWVTWGLPAKSPPTWELGGAGPQEGPQPGRAHPSVEGAQGLTGGAKGLESS